MPSPEDPPSSSTTATATTSDSPISRLLNSLGMTRDELEQHTSRMRQFLDSENALKIARAHAAGDFHASEHALLPEEMLAYIASRENAQEASHELVISQSTRPSHCETTSTPSPTEAPDARPSRSMSRCSNPHSRLHDESDQSPERSAVQRARTSTRERHRTRTAGSPATRPKFSLDEVMQMRARQSRRVSESEESEESGDESLRDVFTKRQAGVHAPHYRYIHPARTSQAITDGANRHYRDTSPAASMKGSYYRDDDSQVPITPQTNRTAQTPTRNPLPKAASYYRHPLIGGSHLSSSSPAPASSPASSPIRFPYNVLSSPGPMSDPPDQFDPDLPYKLPPGPYSEEKPEFSYAALIGQAIMASSNHALRLKDIYDYISIVYPFFKRNGHSHSQKWMNAIRQNLTNTPQFFKREHPSGRQSKGALWCIADKDLPCFADGGYNRHALNPDSAQSQKAEKRKRKKEEKLKEEKLKKARFAAPPMHSQYTYPYGFPQLHHPQFTAAIPTPVHADIIFPPLPADHPNAHLIQIGTDPSESVDEDVIFPPLPPYSQTRIVQEQRLQELSRQSSSSSLVDACSSEASEPAADDVPSSPVLFPPPSSESSSFSVPALTPNNSSSSPCEAEEDADDEDEFAYFSEYIESETQSVQDDTAPTEQEASMTKEDKGKGKAVEAFLFPAMPSIPTSPTTSRGAKQATRSPSTSLYAGSGFLGYAANRSSTPPNDLSMYLGGSSMLTPLSRRNPPSTPTRRRKASDPSEDSLLSGADRLDFLKPAPKTPSRRTDDNSSGAGASIAPITPRKIFSPFIGFSPFRTPSRRGIFDAADPSRILDDELEALAAAKQRASDSPVGLFPRGKGLLYESPSLPSPGKWRPW